MFDPRVDALEDVGPKAILGIVGTRFAEDQSRSTLIPSPIMTAMNPSALGRLEEPGRQPRKTCS